MCEGLFRISDLYVANESAEERIVVNQGGTSSGKTYSIMQLLFVLAMKEQEMVITVCGQDIPNLKKGAYRDAKRILGSSELLRMWFPYVNEGERLIRCVNGSIIEFSSFKDEQDAKSGKRDYLFVNEADGIQYGIYWQLEMRTRRKVFIDFNPTEKFWVHEKLIGRKDVKLIISDHRSNPFLSEEEHRKIEGIEDRELWKVYARGLTGKLIGLIFPTYHIVDEMPGKEEMKMDAWGLDFGYTNDPASLVHVVLAHGELWMDEVLYDSGYDNMMIADVMKRNGLTKFDCIIADAAEPKSIAEINSKGFRVKASEKGPDSITNGIQILKRYRLNVTRRSMGLQKEMKRYKWKMDKNGEMLNVPVDSWNHSIDAVRYVALSKLRAKKVVHGAKATYIELD